jgi:hypothetical protein
VTAQRALSQDELAAMLADATDLSSLSRGPLPAVPDTDFVRTVLRYQLKNGRPPPPGTRASRRRTRTIDTGSPLEIADCLDTTGIC